MHVQPLVPSRRSLNSKSTTVASLASVGGAALEKVSILHASVAVFCIPPKAATGTAMAATLVRRPSFMMLEYDTRISSLGNTFVGKRVYTQVHAQAMRSHCVKQAKGPSQARKWCAKYKESYSYVTIGKVVDLPVLAIVSTSDSLSTYQVQCVLRLVPLGATWCARCGPRPPSNGSNRSVHSDQAARELESASAICHSSGPKKVSRPSHQLHGAVHRQAPCFDLKSTPGSYMTLQSLL